MRRFANADQRFGHLRFRRKSSYLSQFLDPLTWLLLAPEAGFLALAETISGQLLPWYRQTRSWCEALYADMSQRPIR